MSGYTVAAQGYSFALQRDGKPLKTPAAHDFVVPTRALADAIAAEWNAQDPKKPKPATMPLTQLAATSLDIAALKRHEIVNELAGFANSELLCHLAEAPPELTARQVSAWQPLLDWCEETFGAPLKAGHGIMPINQDKNAIDALRKTIAAFDDFRLVGLQNTTQVSGSLILGLSLLSARLKAEEVFTYAELDGLFQIEKWGSDPATEARHAGIRSELAACEAWFTYLTSDV